MKPDTSSCTNSYVNFDAKAPPEECSPSHHPSLPGSTQPLALEIAGTPMGSFPIVLNAQALGPISEPFAAPVPSKKDSTISSPFFSPGKLYSSPIPSQGTQSEAKQMRDLPKPPSGILPPPRIRNPSMAVPTRTETVSTISFQAPVASPALASQPNSNPVPGSPITKSELRQ